MLVYLDEAYERRVCEGRMTTKQDLRGAIMEGAVQWARQKMMTVAAIMGGLLPIMWTTGTCVDVMKRIATPMIGGMVSSTILALIVIPVLYIVWKGWTMSSGSLNDRTVVNPASSQSIPH
jgi:Cu(I)/Ag(I) efflux system membrane protein CusA/SilA